jgi:hypothetical protein
VLTESGDVALSLTPKTQVLSARSTVTGSGGAKGASNRSLTRSLRALVISSSIWSSASAFSARWYARPSSCAVATALRPWSWCLALQSAQSHFGPQSRHLLESLTLPPSSAMEPLEQKGEQDRAAQNLPRHEVAAHRVPSTRRCGRRMALRFSW